MSHLACSHQSLCSELYRWHSFVTSTASPVLVLVLYVITLYSGFLGTQLYPDDLCGKPFSSTCFGSQGSGDLVTWAQATHSNSQKLSKEQDTMPRILSQQAQGSLGIPPATLRTRKECGLSAAVDTAKGAGCVQGPGLRSLEWDHGWTPFSKSCFRDHNTGAIEPMATVDQWRTL